MAGELAVQIGERIRARRTELNLNQRELADLIDEPSVTNQTVSNWERAVNKPSDRYLAKIARALEVEPYYFLAPEDKGETPDLVTAMDTESEQRLVRLEAKLDAIQKQLSGLIPLMAQQATSDVAEGMREIARQGKAAAKTATNDEGAAKRRGTQKG